jgi:iron(III) transport system substrate-binding protein
MRDRKVSRRNILKASTVLAAGSVVPEPPLAAMPESTAISPAMIAAAEKEAMVTFYTAMEIPVAEKLGRAFEARHPGIAVRVKRSGAERVFQRIGEEEEIQSHEVDVVCSTDASHFIRWKRDGLLAAYLPEDVTKHFPPKQVDADGMYATAFALLSPIGYNTSLVNPGDAPKSFADLLDPRWKGRIVKARPDYSGTILTATFQIVRDLGWSYFEKLAQQDVMQVQSAIDPPKRIALGKSTVQADGALSNLLLLKEQGAPVEPIYASEGTPVVTAPSAVFKSAPHPNAARLFQSFLLSVEAQQFLVDASALCSFNTIVKVPPERASLPAIKLMKDDPAAMEAEREEIKARYSRIFRV